MVRVRSNWIGKVTIIVDPAGTNCVSYGVGLRFESLSRITSNVYVVTVLIVELSTCILGYKKVKLSANAKIHSKAINFLIITIIIKNPNRIFHSNIPKKYE